MTSKFLSIVLQRICALFKTKMSSLHAPAQDSCCNVYCTLFMQSLIFMPATFHAWNLNENVNKVSATCQPYFSLLFSNLDILPMFHMDNSTTYPFSSPPEHLLHTVCSGCRQHKVLFLFFHLFLIHSRLPLYLHLYPC